MVNKGLRWLSLLALVAMLGLSAATTSAATAEPVVPGEVVIKLYNAADLPAVAEANGLDPVAVDQFGSRAIYRLRIVDNSSPSDKSQALAQDGRVQYAEPNYVGYTPEGQQRISWAKGEASDATYATQWAPTKMRLAEAHSVSRGAGVTVAVLDTGIDATHPAFAGTIVPGFDFVDMDADPSEVGVAGVDLSYGHGTHVSGLVALAAPDARIMPVRVLDRDGAGNMWVLAEGLKYAVDPDANPATDDGADVINMSISTTRRTNLLAEIIGGVICSELDGSDERKQDGDEGGGSDGEEDGGSTGEEDVSEECEATGRRGTVVVAAAGNRGSTTPEYPAAEGVPGSLAVGASTDEDEIAPFSNRGSWVHVLAPGDTIVSAIPGGGYAVWSGTSMAAPLVAGEAALVRAWNPALRSFDVTDQILGSAKRVRADVRFRIDAAAAVGLR